MADFLNRFERVLRLRGYWLDGAPRPNAARFCAASKFQRHLLYGWLEGQVPTKYAADLAEFLKVNKRWLIDGEGETGDPALDASTLLLPTAAREMQNAEATVRNSESRWYPMTAEEETVIFPLVRAIQEMYRNQSADLFARLLSEVGYMFDNTNKRKNPQIAIALDAFEEIQKRVALRPDTGERRSEPNRRRQKG